MQCKVGIRFGEATDEYFYFEFEMALRYPSEDAKEAVKYINLGFEREGTSPFHVSTPPTSLDGCVFFNSVAVALPFNSISDGSK